MCVRQTPVGQPVSWVLYAVVDRPTSVPGQFRTEPISALEFAQALAAQGYTAAVHRYDDWTITTT
ncbi:hypothetical protein [Nonomuraea lactucae]|uniref:hypothetical protein n=1 Tax=Nonomuraea lactucae TaxID=2249762 RepID=UPI000DE2A33A|nr:hypothetical protein [Nonomuraea lactucae]